MQGNPYPHAPRQLGLTQNRKLYIEAHCLFTSPTKNRSPCCTPNSRQFQTNIKKKKEQKKTASLSLCLLQLGSWFVFPLDKSLISFSSSYPVNWDSLFLTREKEKGRHEYKLGVEGLLPAWSKSLSCNYWGLHCRHSRCMLYFYVFFPFFSHVVVLFLFLLFIMTLLVGALLAMCNTPFWIFLNSSKYYEFLASFKKYIYNFSFPFVYGIS